LTDWVQIRRQGHVESVVRVYETDWKFERGLYEGGSGEVVFAGCEYKRWKVGIVSTVARLREVEIVDSGCEGTETNGERVGTGKQIDVGRVAVEVTEWR